MESSSEDMAEVIVFRSVPGGRPTLPGTHNNHLTVDKLSLQLR